MFGNLLGKEKNFYFFVFVVKTFWIFVDTHLGITLGFENVQVLKWKKDRFF